MEEILGKEIQILDKKYLCKPTFKALILIEQKADCSLVKIFDRYTKGDVHISDVVSILYGCAVAGDPTFNDDYEVFGQKVCEHGMTSLLLPALELIKDSLSGPEDSKKKKTTAKK